MKKMLKSRKFVVIGLLLMALFFIGAMLGSIIPKAITYLIIAAVAVAAVLLIVFGYTGHADYKEANKDIWSSSKSKDDDDGI